MPLWVILASHFRAWVDTPKKSSNWGLAQINETELRAGLFELDPTGSQTKKTRLAGLWPLAPPGSVRLMSGQPARTGLQNRAVNPVRSRTPTGPPPRTPANGRPGSKAGTFLVSFHLGWNGRLVLWVKVSFWRERFNLARQREMLSFWCFFGVFLVFFWCFCCFGGVFLCFLVFVFVFRALARIFFLAFFSAGP